MIKFHLTGDTTAFPSVLCFSLKGRSILQLFQEHHIRLTHIRPVQSKPRFQADFHKSILCLDHPFEFCFPAPLGISGTSLITVSVPAKRLFVPYMQKVLPFSFQICLPFPNAIFAKAIFQASSLCLSPPVFPKQIALPFIETDSLYSSISQCSFQIFLFVHSPHGR